MLYGRSFKLAFLMDVASQYYLGVTASIRATAAPVEKPIQEALEENDGQGPKEFILSDNGGLMSVMSTEDSLRRPTSFKSAYQPVYPSITGD